MSGTWTIHFQLSELSEVAGRRYAFGLNVRGEDAAFMGVRVEPTHNGVRRPVSGI